MCVRFGRVLRCIGSVPGSKMLLGNGKNTWENKTRRRKKSKDMEKQPGVYREPMPCCWHLGPVGDSNTGAALPCKSKVAVLQPGKSAQSMRIPACILFAKHGNLVTINRGEQKTVCADSVPIITAGNKPHQNRSHDKIFPPPPRAALLYDFTLWVLTQKHFKSARWITNLCPCVSDSTGKEAPSIGRQMFYMYLVLNELHAYEVLNKWSLQEVFFNLVFFYIPKSLYNGPKSCKIITSVP